VKPAWTSAPSVATTRYIETPSAEALLATTLTHASDRNP
jgi:hypothetical protein